MEDEDAWPDEISMQGGTFLIVAIKLGRDKDGKMRYAMRFDNGEPVRLSRVQYRRTTCGLAFNTRIGPVVFDFAMEEENC